MPRIPIFQRMAESPLVFDGAMGTVIYSRGVFINRCFDEVTLTDPGLVLSIHREYAEAGAEVIETNTFGANRVKLRGYNLADSVVRICREGARLAREAAQGGGEEGVYVAGSIGPCLRVSQALNPENEKAVREAFAETAGALAEGGVDCLILETFFDLDELAMAIEAAAATRLPVIASCIVDAHGETARGRKVEDIVSALDADGRVGAIGFNCGTGPAPLYESAERAVRLTRKPIIVMPNAGQPVEIEGRMLYLTNPEYFTEYAKRLVQVGVRGVGGCCGTTPEHIRTMARAVRSLSGVKKHIRIESYTARAAAGVEAVPVERKSPFGAKLAKGEPVTSIELLPPRSSDLSGLLARARQCREAGIDAINIPDGPRASARVSPMIAAIAVQRDAGIEPILHYCCRDRNLIGMQSDLLGGFAVGLANFLIITGDPPKVGEYPNVTGVFDVDAIGLTQIVSNLNHGLDIGGNPIAPPTAILIGVGVNPCAVEMKTEIERFRRKIDAGAEYAITQPVFDAGSMLRFLDSVADFCTIPVIAGVWPLTSFKNAEFMKNEVPGVEVPDSILERMRTCSTKEEGWRMGVEIAREIRAMIAPRVAGFQVSAPFGKVELALDVLK